MPSRLKRHQTEGHDHFITFNCYRRLTYLNNDHSRIVFGETLEGLRQRHQFSLFRYVLMPEHVHLLLSEPKLQLLATTLSVLKGETSKLLKEDRPQFWQTRYYDFNVLTHRKHVEKLRYMHRNPVTRGLVTRPEDWPWSSIRHYATGGPGRVGLSLRGRSGAIPANPILPLPNPVDTNLAREQPEVVLKGWFLLRSARFRLLALLPLLALTLAARADTLDQFTITGGGESLSVLLPAYTPLALFDNQVTLSGPGVFDGVVGDYNVHIIFPGSCAICSTIFSPLPELGLPALFDFPYISGTTFFHLLPGTYTTFEVGPNFVPPGGPYTITITPQSTTPTPESPTLLLLGTGIACSTLLIAGRRLH